jgi:hypothetical protein
VSPGYDRFALAASHVGSWILAIAVTTFVLDLIVMSIYTIRQGKSDDRKGTVITEKRAMGSMSIGVTRQIGRSKLKILGSKSGFVTDDSLVDGTATLGQRLMVLGIIGALISFIFIFVAAGLMLMKETPAALLFPAISGLWLYSALREMWQGHQQAKKRVAARRHKEKP